MVADWAVVHDWLATLAMDVVQQPVDGVHSALVAVEVQFSAFHSTQNSKELSLNIFVEYRYTVHLHDVTVPVVGPALLPI